MTKTEMVRVAVLSLDYTLYPRSKVDDTHVAHIADALRAGVRMPPIIVDRKSKRPADGFHRIKAHRRVFGDDAEIEVEWRDYKSDAELYLDAMRLNASHGVNLTPFDRTVAITKALDMKLDPERIAKALNMTTERVTEFLEIRTTKMRRGATAFDGDKRVALKWPVRHMRDRALTKEQAGVMGGLGGNSQLFYVNQLLDLIRTDMLDTADEHLMAALVELHKALEGVVAVPA